MKTLMSALVSGIVTLSLLGLMSITGCSSVKSAASALMPGEKKPEEKIKVGARLHLKVPPQVALILFQDVASKNDWKVLNAGDQRDINGEVKGKFFRVETIQFVGGRRIMSGVFFKEKDDDETSYVTMGKPGADVEYGIPLALVKPMQAAVAEWTGEPEERDELDERDGRDDEAISLEEALRGDPWAGGPDERDDEDSPLEEALSGDEWAGELDELDELDGLDELDELDGLDELDELDELDDEESPLEEALRGDL